MPARPTPLILLLLVAGATGNGPELSAATATQGAPGALGDMGCAALQRELGAMPDLAGMQVAGMAAGIGTSLLGMVPVAGGLMAEAIGQATALARQQAIQQVMLRRQQAASRFRRALRGRRDGRRRSRYRGLRAGRAVLKEGTP